MTSSRRDRAELQRCLLDNHLQARVARKEVQRSKALRAFVLESERHDWPDALGAIDLSIHDAPHESSATEWWYYNCHLTTIEGKKYSLFVAFFRVVKHTDKGSGKKSYAHALNWALTDVQNKRYVHESVLDRDSPAIVKKQLDTGNVIKDPRLLKAYMEVLDRGNVPLPDRMFTRGDPSVDLSKLDLDFESGRVEKNEQGEYILSCSTPNGLFGADLVLTPQKQPVRHGLNGVVKGHDGDDMFYYCIPRCAVRGSVTVDGAKAEVDSSTEGASSAWYDHEFGGVSQEDTDMPAMQYAWNWAAIQLSDGYDVSVATLVDPRSKPHRLMEKRAIVMDRDGNRTAPTDLQFIDRNAWTSVRSFNTYPTQWDVQIRGVECDGHTPLDMQLRLEAPFDDQEFVTLIAKPGFWEGRVQVSGTHNGKAVSGLAYVEVNGFNTLTELDSFFKAVGQETRKAVQEVYPDVVDDATAINLIATPETKHYIEGVDYKTFKAGIIDPVRYISDMGGKSWRSYGALACMDVVGGDSRKFVRWLSMPEFMHVGSLIIDDIEDESTKRRGVPCCHIQYGQAIAINSGTAAYFQGQQLLLVPGLSATQLNKVYDYYFAALRAGHAGQALDIAGLDYLMDEVIERGDATLAESRSLAIHRLKTAVPAASLARMGALVGGGTEDQIRAVGLYYESIGIAFQIMDDVLNLRGLFTGKADKTAGMQLKNLGEDISAGKVTMPVVKAIGLLPKSEMRELWAVIKSKPAQPAQQHIIDGVIAKLEACGAIDACVKQSQTLVDDAFAQLHPVIPDSFSKIMLRAFGWFVTERTK